jgi:hypothetical protein
LWRAAAFRGRIREGQEPGGPATSWTRRTSNRGRIPRLRLTAIPAQRRACQVRAEGGQSTWKRFSLRVSAPG